MSTIHIRDKRDKLIKPVLVLNSGYEPIHICSARRAMIMVFKGKAVVEELSGSYFHTSQTQYPLPSVVRLQDYRKIPQYKYAVSRKNILIRDNHTCQYCNVQHKAKDLTLDHIIPRKYGGQNLWNNLVSCCLSCNIKKGSRTPEEADMPLKHKPRDVSCHTRHLLLRMSSENVKIWQKYVYY